MEGTGFPKVAAGIQNSLFSCTTSQLLGHLDVPTAAAEVGEQPWSKLSPPLFPHKVQSCQVCDYYFPCFVCSDLVLIHNFYL